MSHLSKLLLLYFLAYQATFVFARKKSEIHEVKSYKELMEERKQLGEIEKKLDTELKDKNIDLKSENLKNTLETIKKTHEKYHEYKAREMYFLAKTAYLQIKAKHKNLPKHIEKAYSILQKNWKNIGHLLNKKTIESKQEESQIEQKQESPQKLQKKRIYSIFTLMDGLLKFHKEKTRWFDKTRKIKDKILSLCTTVVAAPLGLAAATLAVPYHRIGRTLNYNTPLPNLIYKTISLSNKHKGFQIEGEENLRGLNLGDVKGNTVHLVLPSHRSVMTDFYLISEFITKHLPHSLIFANTRVISPFGSKFFANSIANLIPEIMPVGSCKGKYRNSTEKPLKMLDRSHNIINYPQGFVPEAGVFHSPHQNFAKLIEFFWGKGYEVNIIPLVIEAPSDNILWRDPTVTDAPEIKIYPVLNNTEVEKLVDIGGLNTYLLNLWKTQTKIYTDTKAEIIVENYRNILEIEIENIVIENIDGDS